jgi:hypothetical protein
LSCCEADTGGSTGHQRYATVLVTHTITFYFCVKTSTSFMILSF